MLGVVSVQLQDNIPRDLITHRRNGQVTVDNSVRAYHKCKRGVHFHNKPIPSLTTRGQLGS